MTEDTYESNNPTQYQQLSRPPTQHSAKIKYGASDKVQREVTLTNYKARGIQLV